MSVFGGDSWAREAQQRKRRVDDLMLQQNNLQNPSSSSYKKLSNGKYACLVCPNNPVLDSLLMLSMHSTGSRHIAAESRLKEQELWKQREVNKRIALSDSTSSLSSSASSQCLKPSSSLLIECTRKETSEAVRNPQTAHKQRKEPPPSLEPSTSNDNEQNSSLAREAAVKILKDHQEELSRHREKELKFIEAGWKRDCYGRWFRDENVEFDSDEEDPNVCLF